MKLIDRHVECGVLDGMLEAIGAGESRGLVVSGEQGVGKTEMHEYLSDQGSGCHWPGLRACSRRWNCRSPDCIVGAPMLDNLARLPLPQREALRPHLA
jgi:hypothetical protein